MIHCIKHLVANFTEGWYQKPLRKCAGYSRVNDFVIRLIFKLKRSQQEILYKRYTVQHYHFSDYLFINNEKRHIECFTLRDDFQSHISRFGSQSIEEPEKLRLYI